MTHSTSNSKINLSISKKLLMLVLFTSTLATTVSSLFQIAMEYKVAKDSQYSEFSVFESSAIPGMQNSFWSYNDQALNDQLSSSITNLDFVKIQILDESKKVIAQKSKDIKVHHSETRVFSLKNPHNDKETIGSVELTFTNDFIVEELWRKSMWIVIANFIKTMIVSGILMNLFNRYIVNRLNFLSKNLEDPNWSESEAQDVQRQFWPYTNTDDEISRIEAALIEAHTAIRQRTQGLKDSAMGSARLAELGIFASGISHEINNPLSIIAGNIQSFDRHISANSLTPEVVKKVSDRTLNAVTRIKKIIAGLSSLSRDGGSDPMETVQVQNLLQDTLNLCEATLKGRNVNFEFKVEPPDLSLECKTVQFSQIILNLINNAADAIEGSDDKWIKIHFYHDQVAKNVVFTITDSGHGIPAKIQEKIFVPFFTTKPVGKGTGLGLAIVHGMIQAHGGSISINNQSKNTQFVIRLPAQELRNAA